MHICVSKLTIMGSDNGLSSDQHQAIIWTNAEISLFGPLRKKLQWNLNRNSYIFIQEIAFENIVCKMVAILSQPQCIDIEIIEWYFHKYAPPPPPPPPCLSLNVLILK